jgi:hypothetical protein
MLNTEVKAHAQLIYAHLIAAWNARRDMQAGPREFESFATSACMAAKTFDEVAKKQ